MDSLAWSVGLDDLLDPIIMQTLAVIGDHRTLDMLRRGSWWRNNVMLKPSFRHHVNNAVYALRANLEQDSSNATLLRPASPPTEETLLRPAANVPATDAAQLVRPADDPATLEAKRDE